MLPVSKQPARPGAGGIPACAGVSFKACHAQDILAQPGDVGWFEVHPENYMVAGGPRLRQLEQLRTDYPLSLHGVGLSLGGGTAPDRKHLAALRALVDRFEPGLVSEHLAWSMSDGRYLPDLLPVPLNAASLSSLVEAICITQDAIGRQILIENPSSYFSAPDSTISEAEFITCVARQSGCGLLVDVNNVYVSAHNLVFDADDYLNALPASLIGEIHLAGHTREQAHGDDILLDSHGTPVSEPVWALYARLLARTGAIPTLIERDNAIPTWRDLAAEATRADQIAAALHPRQRSVAN